MNLHAEKTLKTTIEKNLSNLKNVQEKYLWLSFVIVNRFTVILLMILKLMILWNFILKIYFKY